jgi:hypothetical protein
MSERPEIMRQDASSTGEAEWDDATLVARAGDGDVHAFERLVTRYQRSMYRLALRPRGGGCRSCAPTQRSWGGCTG